MQNSPDAAQSPETTELPLRTIQAAYQRSDTGIQIYQQLASRGFVIDSSTTVSTETPDIFLANIVLRQCDDAKFTQALRQIQKIVTVLKAVEVPIDKVMQHVKIRTITVGDELRKIVRKQGAHIDENIGFSERPERELPRITKELHQKKVKMIRSKKEITSGQTGEKDARGTLVVRVRNLRDDVRDAIANMGGEVLDIAKIHFVSDPIHIRAFQAAIQEHLPADHKLHIGPPSVGSMTILDRDNEAQA